MSNLYTLAEAVRRVESVPVEAQTILKDVILETLYRKKSAACFRECGERIALLEQAELAIRVDAPDVAMDFLGRNEIIKRLDDCGVVGFKRNMKLEDKDDEINRLLEKYGHLRCPIWDGPKEDFRD